MRKLREDARESCSRFSDAVFEKSMLTVLKDGCI